MNAMNLSSGNDCAFPTPTEFRSDGALISHGSPGLTKRELFAAMAMQGSLAGEPGPHLQSNQLARESVAHADALLAELDRPVKS